MAIRQNAGIPIASVISTSEKASVSGGDRFMSQRLSLHRASDQSESSYRSFASSSPVNHHVGTNPSELDCDEVGPVHVHGCSMRGPYADLGGHLRHSLGITDLCFSAWAELNGFRKRVLASSQRILKRRTRGC